MTTALETIVRSFSPIERLLYAAFVLLLAIGAGLLILRVNNLFLVDVPAAGGVFREGIVGAPRFVNPLLALSDADRDLVALLYSGLLKATPDGALIPDLALRFAVSDDGRSYTFTIRDDARFHDGTPVTSDDVVFTIQKAQEPALKSPKRANWEGVAVEKRGERDVALTLKQPYAPFLENATLGILPKHIWKDTDAELFPFSPYNSEPVGSGPYRMTNIKRNDSGIPRSYELEPFGAYPLGTPLISKLILRFYPNEKELLSALREGEIESVNTITPEGALRLREENYRVERTPLPRVFAVFFNQNQQPLFAEKVVRQALSLATDKDLLVNAVLHGYGVPIDAPVPPLLLNGGERDVGVAEAALLKAGTLLEKAKWVRNEKTGIRERKKGKEVQMLSFSLITSNVPELRESAELLKRMWGKIGADVRVQIFESGDLNQNVIRPRKYDALLFGEIIGRDLDLFAFWHSSQRNDPGLNIALYTNSKVDKLLEAGRRERDEEVRLETHRNTIAEITRDAPAVFLYSPEFIYVLPHKIKGFTLRRLTIPSERFLAVEEWYINTEKVWSIFTKNQGAERL